MPKITIDNSTSVPDLESRLLLLTARTKLDSSQLEQVKALTQEISDWDTVTETATKKFSAPYLFSALTALNSATVPQDAMRRLKQVTYYTKLRALKIASAQMAFHKTCIEPNNVRHAYLKGNALSAQFGGNFANRFCRDIDVLVDEQRFEDVVLTAKDLGYRIVLCSKPAKFAESRNDLSFIMRFFGDVGLLSPDGILIEVHRRLDKSSLIFDTNSALESVETVMLLNTAVQTLEPHLHFTYACYHHSRHLWSRLHWIADLDLMIRSKKLDNEYLETTAASIGLDPTVNASIEFHELTLQTNLWKTDGKDGSLAQKFLAACVLNLSGGLELEFELRKTLVSHDLMTKSQMSPDKMLSATVTNWKSKFHPISSQYTRLPLPSPFFWLYRVQRPFLTWGDRIARFISSSIRMRWIKAYRKSTNQLTHEDNSN